MINFDLPVREGFLLWLAVGYFAITGFFTLRKMVRDTIYDRILIEREKALLEILRLKIEILQVGNPQDKAKISDLVTQALALPTRCLVPREATNSIAADRLSYPQQAFPRRISIFLYSGFRERAFLS
jgi:hypothetical protein